MYKIYHGDCLEVMKKWPDNYIDLVVTDPPYAINYQAYRTGRGNIINDNTTDWIEAFVFQTTRILKKGSHFYCFVDPEMSGYFTVAMIKHGLKIRNFLTIPRAVKGNGGDRIFQQQFEFCIFATKGNKNEGRKFNQTKILKPSEGYLKDKRYSAKEWLYRLPDNWYWVKASEHNSKNKLHPTQKTVEVFQNMIQLSSNEGDIVLDPFMGSGSTGVAALKENRRFIGIELDEKYFQIAKERIEGVS